MVDYGGLPGGDRREREPDSGQAQEVLLSGIGIAIYVDGYTCSTRRQTRVDQVIEARRQGDEWAVWTEESERATGKTRADEGQIRTGRVCPWTPQTAIRGSLSTAKDFRSEGITGTSRSISPISRRRAFAPCPPPFLTCMQNAYPRGGGWL